MVVILPASEKVEPPPYTRDDPKSSSAPSSSRAPPVPPRTSSDGGPTPSRAKNYLRVARVNEDIVGRWVINPTLRPPTTLTSPAQTEGPNVIFETLQKGNIDVIVAWETPESSQRLPRAKVEATSYKGDVVITNTTRPKGLPLHIKCTSQRRGDVKICTPPDFRGILALRIPSSSSDWRSRIGLAAQIQENVSATRETVCRIKNKDKQKANPNVFLADAMPTEDQILVEFLIGDDLEVSDFNRIADTSEDALDLVDVEVKDGRIMVLSPEDAALRNDPFPELSEAPPLLPQAPPPPSADASKPGKPWKVGAHSNLAGGVTVSKTANTDANGITIVINEPRWFGSMIKKFGKFGESKSKSYPAARDELAGAKGNKNTLSPHSSTSTLVSTIDVPRNSTSSAAASPQQSPRSSSRIDRSVASQIVPKFADDYEDLLPGDLRPPPPRREHRSASTSNAPRPYIAPPSPQPHQRRMPSDSNQPSGHRPQPPPSQTRSRPSTTSGGSGRERERRRPPALCLSDEEDATGARRSRCRAPSPRRDTFPNPRSPNSTMPWERRHSRLTPQAAAAMGDPRQQSQQGRGKPPSPNRQSSSPSSSTSGSHQKLQKCKPNRVKSSPDLRDKAKRRSHEPQPPRQMAPPPRREERWVIE